MSATVGLKRTKSLRVGNSGDKSIQLLIFGWIFSSFLQGVAGYGVPIAVVAPLLIGLGFSPVVAVAVPAIGHSWSSLHPRTKGL